MIDDVGGNIDLAPLAQLWGHGQSRGPARSSPIGILVRCGAVVSTAYAVDMSVKSAPARVGDVHELAMAMPYARVEPGSRDNPSIRSVASRSSSSAIRARTPLTLRLGNATRT